MQAPRTRLASGPLLLVLVLAALRIPIRPGPSLTAREWRRSPTSWLLAAFFLAMAAQQLMRIGAPPGAADPFAIVVAGLGRQLAVHLWLTLLVALPAAVLLYRNLERRFEQLEAPLPSKSMDRWFMTV